VDVLIAGCGWLGREVARRLVARGDRVTGLTRTEESAAKLREDGIASFSIDLTIGDVSRDVPGRYDAIVSMLSASGRDPSAYRRAYVDATRHLLDATTTADVAFVYVGSTGVFGQTDGSWVDERTPTQTSDATSAVLIEAERLVLDRSRPRARPCVVRCSGLYGPQRAGTLERVRTGALALGAGDTTWMNFCHRDDAASTVVAALERGEPGAIYHASDAEPATRHDVVAWIAARLGVTPTLRLGDTEPSGRRATNRRVSAEATRRALGVALAYPTFREGFEPLF
jgi:nucleoside-diphosphate-sugar epimerase